MNVMPVGDCNKLAQLQIEVSRFHYSTCAIFQNLEKKMQSMKFIRKLADTVRNFTGRRPSCIKG